MASIELFPVPGPASPAGLPGDVATASSADGGRTPGRGLGQAGFSLIETLIALGLGVMLGAAFLSVIVRFASYQLIFSSLIRNGEALQTVPALVNRFAAGAGNRQPGASGVGIQGETLLLRSDLDGPEGFPDGNLGESFESLSVRVRDGRLQFRSGGGSYQTLLEGLQELAVTRPESRCLHLNVSAITDLQPSLVHAGIGAELEFEVFLWNYRPLLFPSGSRGGSPE